MSVEDQLREYRATLDAATETAATSPERGVAPVIRIHPARTLVLAAVAVAAAIAIAFAAVGVSHRSSTPPAGPETTTSSPAPTSTSSSVTAAPTIAVPNVVGTTQGAADRVLGSLGFVVHRSAVSCATGALGNVAVQAPAASSRLEHGGLVNVSVCASRPAGLTRTLPVSVCKTEHGAVPFPSYHGPTSITIAAPQFDSPQLAPYTDDGGFLMTIGPKGWNCTALDAGDGSVGVELIAPGTHFSTRYQHGLTNYPGVDGVFAHSDGACQGCIYGEVCHVVRGVDAQFPNYASPALCDPQPKGETSRPLGNHVYEVEDVAGVYGPDAARTFLRYGPPSPTVDATLTAVTCALPPSENAVCTAMLDDFLVLHP